MPQVVEVRHPLVQHHLARLRDKSTPPVEFRALIQRLTGLLAYEATQDLLLRDVAVETPLTTMTGQTLAQQLGLVPILRAGLGMVDAVLDLIPSAEVWHLGLYRDEATALPVEYYSKLPKTRPVEVGIVLDPMLATGGSAIAALEALQDWGVPSIKLLAIIASQDGIRAVTSRFPQVQIYTCAVDPELNSRKFIVPGLGDAGDRTFNTLRG
jgi:uracil phosphoribosyltransferase